MGAYPSVIIGVIGYGVIMGLAIWSATEAKSGKSRNIDIGVAALSFFMVILMLIVTFAL